MREDLARSPPSPDGETLDPIELARRDQAKSAPRRFYKTVGVVAEGDLFALVLDGKRARTPARNVVATPARQLSEALAAEWSAQGEFINRADMPLTRLVNSALDNVAGEIAATIAEVVKYAGSDLLCYRASEPAALAREQAENWDHILAWASERLGARFNLAEGVIFVEQPAASLAAIAEAVNGLVGVGHAAPLRAAALNVVTTLTGSAILALAVASGRVSAQDAWNVAHIDEDFQIRAWGQDAQALARRMGRWREMEAAALALDALKESASPRPSDPERKS